jgi:quinoprotein relay system zinc metallohydrolase 2
MKPRVGLSAKLRWQRAMVMAESANAALLSRRGFAGALATAVMAGSGGAAVADELPIREVAPGTFVHVGAHEPFSAGNLGAIANSAFVVGRRSVAVLDCGGSRAFGERLLAAVRRRTDLPVTYLVNTHAHPDHAFGNAAFAAAGATILGHARQPRAMAERGPHYLANLAGLMGVALAGTELIPAQRTVAEHATAELDLGERTLLLRAWPTAHTDNDLTVFDEATGTMFAGDLLFMERLPVVDGSLNGWLGVMDALARIDARQVVPGHGPAAAPWPAALAAQARYLSALRDRLRAIIAEGIGLGAAVDAVPMPGSDPWLLAAENHPRNVMAGYAEMEWE